MKTGSRQRSKAFPKAGKRAEGPETKIKNIRETNTLSVAATAGLHGWQFRCVVTDANGQKSYSDVVTLSVK